MSRIRDIRSFVLLPMTIFLCFIFTAETSHSWGNEKEDPRTGESTWGGTGPSNSRTSSNRNSQARSYRQTETTEQMRERRSNERAADRAAAERSVEAARESRSRNRNGEDSGSRDYSNSGNRGTDPRGGTNNSSSAYNTPAKTPTEKARDTIGDHFRTITGKAKDLADRVIRRVAPVTYGAVKAGFNKSAKTDFQDESQWTRDFYKGVNDYYSKKGTKKSERFVPSGPISQMTHGKDGYTFHDPRTGESMYAGTGPTNKEENDVRRARQIVEKLDELFMDKDLALPGHVLRDLATAQIPTATGKPWGESLDATTLLGERNTLTVVTDKEKWNEICGGCENVSRLVDGESYKGLSTDILGDIIPGGTVFVERPPGGIDEETLDILSHEWSHAGELVVAEEAGALHGDLFSDYQKNGKHEGAMGLSYSEVKDAAYYADVVRNQAETVDPVEYQSPTGTSHQFYDDYLSQATEINAFNQQPFNSASNLADRIENKLNGPGQPGVTRAEAERIGRILSESEVVKDGRETMNKFAEALMSDQGGL